MQPLDFFLHLSLNARMNPISFSDAVRVWITVALNSFGGPAAHISVMHRILVEEKKWIGENRFLHALNYCMLLPGPEAQQLAIYLGNLLHGVKGGIVAGTLFVLPGFISILFLSIAYSLFFDTALFQGLFYGIKPAVLAIVMGALIKIGKKALKNKAMYIMAALSFISIFFLNMPFPFIIIAAGLTGYFGGKFREDLFLVIKTQNADEENNSLDNSRPPFYNTIRTVFIWSLLWFIPVILLFGFLGKENIFVKEALFFSKTAVVTFGGAYSVLAYIAQRAVESYHWLSPGEMLDGLGMAETTPGPLIQVVQFVGYMGAYYEPGPLHPVLAGIFASLIVTWTTFVPCFLFIFAGAPYIQWLEGNKRLSMALSGITATVVGVILNLSIWFALHLFFREHHEFFLFPLNFSYPDIHSIELAPMILSALAVVLYFYFKLAMLKTIAVNTILGAAYFFANRYWN